MSGDAKKDLAMAMLTTVDEAWNAIYDWVKEKIGPEEDEEEFPEEPPEATLVQQVGDLRMRISAVNEAWNAHMKHHDKQEYLTGAAGRAIWREINLLKERTEREPPKPPTLVEKLEIQKLEQNMEMHERHLAGLFIRIEELERKEAAHGVTGEGAHGTIRIPVDHDGTTIRVWSQASGAGRPDAGYRIASSNAVQAGEAGPDTVSEARGPDAVQSAGGEHVPAADGGARPG